MRVAVIMLFALGCGRLAFETSSGDAGGSLDDWSVRRRLGLRNASRAEALVDFPAMVALDPTRFDYAKAAPDGRDLRFADAATGAELAYEIEAWQPGGRSIVWVRVPHIEARSDASAIIMYSGNPAAPPPSIAASMTWSSDYLAVFHMAGSLADSTATALAGTTSAVGYSVGPIADVMAISQGAFARIAPGPAVEAIITMSGMLRVDAEDMSGYTSLITAPIVGAITDRLYLGWHAGRPFAETTDDSNINSQLEGDPVMLRRWTHLGLVLDVRIATLYVDGVLARTSTYQGAPGPRELGLFIGADCEQCQLDAPDANIDYLGGAIDELRFERVVRSAAWMDAQSAALRDELVAY